MRSRVLLSLLLWVVNLCAAAENVLTVRVIHAGELAEKSGKEYRKVETLKIIGPINEADFATLRDAAYGGSLIGLDLSETEIRGKKIPDYAFDPPTGDNNLYRNGCATVRRVILPDILEEIGESAFAPFNLLSDVNIPKGLKKIGNGAFEGCRYLNFPYLELPKGISEVGNNAFSGCLKIASVSLPNTLKSIGDGAFRGAGLEKILFSEGLERIGEYAFSGCKKLSEVVLPNSVRAINKYAFAYNTLLERFVLPPDFECIPAQLLTDDFGLKDFVVPENVEYIGWGALCGCSGLESVELPEGLRRLDLGALSTCVRLTSLMLPSTLETVCAESLSGLTSLKTISCKAAVPPVYSNDGLDYATPFETSNTEALIPTPKHLTLYVPVGSADLYRAAPGWNYFDKIVETNVFPEAPAALEEIAHMDLRTTRVGELATLLGDKVRSVKSLKVTGPVDESDFAVMLDAAYLGRMEELDLGGADVEGRIIPAMAFGKTSGSSLRKYVCLVGLKRVELPDNIEEIGENAFYSACFLEEINMPSSLKRIGKDAFNTCLKLNAASGELILPDGLEKIDSGAFENCIGLRNVRFPTTLRSIGDYAFRNTSLASIWIPEGLEALGANAFSNCDELKHADLPNSVKSIGNSAFYSDFYLETLHLPEEIGSIPKQLAMYGFSLKEVNLPPTAEWYGPSAFNYCISVQSVHLSGSYKNVNRGAFQGCGGIEQVVLPKEGAWLDARVFGENPGLRRIYSPAPYPPNCYVENSKYHREVSSFESKVGPYDPLWDTPNDIPVYVPVGSKEYYRSAPGWNFFTNFIETDRFPASSVDGPEAESREVLVEILPGRVVFSASAAKSGADYSVYNIDGRLAAAGRVGSGSVEIPLASGLYIVATPGSRTKVAVP